jgi:hypothetical protein
MKKKQSKKLSLHRETLNQLTVMGGIRTNSDGELGGCNSFYTCGSCAYACTNTTCDPDSEYACCTH